jgi:hypothetical protein
MSIGDDKSFGGGGADQAHRHNGSAHRPDDSSNATGAGISSGTTDASAPSQFFGDIVGASSRRRQWEMVLLPRRCERQ